MTSALLGCRQRGSFEPAIRSETKQSETRNVRHQENHKMLQMNSKLLDTLYEFAVAKDGRADSSRKKREWLPTLGFGIPKFFLEYNVTLGMTRGWPLKTRYKNASFQWLDESLDSEGRYVFDRETYNSWLKSFLNQSESFEGLVSRKNLSNGSAQVFTSLESSQSNLIEEWLYVVTSEDEDFQNRFRVKVAPAALLKMKSLKEQFGVPSAIQSQIEAIAEGFELRGGYARGFAPIPAHSMLAQSDSGVFRGEFLSRKSPKRISALAAGTLSFDQEGRIVEVTNSSGHFLPEVTRLKSFLQLLFALHGVGVGSGQGNIKTGLSTAAFPKWRLFERPNLNPGTTELQSESELSKPIEKFYCGFDPRVQFAAEKMRAGQPVDAQTLEQLKGTIENPAPSICVK
jgi:hypothetical protein